MSFAPTIFKVVGAPAAVIKQPETKEEHDAVDQAIAGCPVQAISNEKKEEPMKMAA